MSIINMMI